MKILIYSTKKYLEKSTGWFRGGYNIAYKSNGIIRSEINKVQNAKNDDNIFTYRTLSFSYEFQYDDDNIFFAYCYPYTYSDLQEYITNIEKNSQNSAYFY